MEGGGRGISLHYENGETLEQIACGDQKLTDAEKQVQMLLSSGAR